MLRIKQATTAILFAIMMVTSMAAQAKACESEQPVQAKISHCSTDTQVAKVEHNQDSNKHSGKEQHTQHCHCVNQVCCGFLVVHEISSVEITSLEKSSPLVSVALSSWVAVPPTRPPSA